MSQQENWMDICKIDAIVPNAGRCALVNGEQVAIFRVRKGGSDELYAIHNFDPFSNANVISRGIVGTLSDKLVVASPIYKQHFCLQTGQCLEEEATQLKVWPVRLQDDVVQLST